MEPRSGCPINAAVEVLGDRWSLIVLRDVIFGDRRYFRALLTGSIEGIASNILADRLVRLVEAGILTRGTAFRGQRARYSLTEAGIQTLPIIYALGNWGLDWRPGSGELGAGSSSCAMKVRRSSRSSWTNSASATSTPRRSRTTVRARSSASTPPTPRPPSKNASINGDGTAPP
ncbi:winged helix-turn-helix transcriptional regulator [Dactylosporangium darangshiense]|uniref:winged helix-turn-helix transcriptional regulator n=1 Tax=Dactylosporangium darangshiense TaxID=579108 RepID=UPI00363E15BD